MNYEMIKQCVGFQWDDGNSDKNWILHQVTRSECEQIFFNQPLILGCDDKHSITEQRIYALGQTDENRTLFIACTIREKLIRIISARDMSKKEREVYSHEK
ncbi:MAG: BrnT family toxin [Methyloprofundus sp.]|nr:BrnT family toxin [Methyloprofundus sp.]